MNESCKNGDNGEIRNCESGETCESVNNFLFF